MLINQLMEKVQKNPIVVYRPDVATKVTEIPFPAVTYCSAIKPPDKIHNFSVIQNLFSRIDNLDFEE